MSSSCLLCGGNDGIYHIGRYHFEACHSCQVAWLIGIQVCDECQFSSYEEACSKLDEWEANKAYYRNFELVEGVPNVMKNEVSSLTNNQISKAQIQHRSRQGSRPKKC